jgi:hypothetical protein
MKKTNVDIAEAYYTAWGAKKVADMAKFLHQDVRLVGPVGEEIVGKPAILEGLKQGASRFNTLKIRTKFGSQDQVMLALDLDFPPKGILRTVSLLTLSEGLIVKIELFFDTRHFENLIKGPPAAHAST